MESLLQSGVSRVVMGIRNPLLHMRGAGEELLRSNGVQVLVLEDHPLAHEASSEYHSALLACLAVNEVSTPSLMHGLSCRKCNPFLDVLFTW